MLAIAQRTKQTGVEVGGLLTGCVSRSMIEIISAHGPGPRAEFAKDRYRPDLEHDLALAEKTRTDSDGLIQAVGSFHTHPGGTADPSTFDQTALRTWKSIFDIEQFAGLILDPTRFSFDVVPFVIRSGFGDSDDVTEPAWVDVIP
jgi:integrative and conjugative element protein (TIGR02256 family)